MKNIHTTYILDFDSTIVSCESLDELARIALAGAPNQAENMARLEALTTEAMAGIVAFDESLRRRLQLFQATQDDIIALIADLKQRVTPSLLAHKDWLARNKEHIYIISGGFEEYIKPIATMLGLLPEHVYANRFTYDTNRNITGYDDSLHTSRSGGKVGQVRALDLPHPLIAIGDGYTDYELKGSGEADEFWAFAEHVQRPRVIAKADRVLRSFADMPALRDTRSDYAKVD